MAAANVLLTISHVVDFSDNPRCRQSPCIYFWGTTDDRNHLIQLEHCIEVIKPILDGSPPPMHHNMLGDLVCCALVKNRWVRAKLTDSKMDHQGMLEVICIDSGTQSSVPLGFLRSLQIPGREATTLREWPPLASKFILADVVAPRGEWSESALIFLKSRLENHTWKAATLGCYNGYTGVRLYDHNNQLLATTMIQQGLAVAAASYQEAVATCPQYEEEPNWAKPASSPSPPPSPNNLLSLLQQVRNHQYSTIYLPVGKLHQIKILNAPTGPYQFTVQPTWTQDFTKLLVKLEALTRSGNLVPLPPLSREGTPCLAVALGGEKKLQRGILTTALGSTDDPVGVHFVDTDRHDLVSPKLIFDIPDELLNEKFFTYRVSLVDGERLSNCSGFTEAFCLLVANKTDRTFHCQVKSVASPDVVDLYDDTGMPIRDVLIKLYENMARKKPHLSSSCSMSPCNSPCLVEIPPCELKSEEELLIIHAETGSFFGRLTNRPNAALDALSQELFRVYENNPDLPLLYADVQSHLNHYGVIKNQDERYYRVVVVHEKVHDVAVRLIDFGNSLLVPRRQIYAPIASLTNFWQPPFGIRGAAPELLPSRADLAHTLIGSTVRVLIGPLLTDGIYTVQLVENPANKKVLDGLRAKLNESKSPVGQSAAQVDDTNKLIPDKTTTTSNSPLESVVPIQDVPVAPSASAPVVKSTASDQVHQAFNGKSRSPTKQELPRYQHPNAVNGGVGRAKEGNWRNSNGTMSEVIREPRGPPTPVDGARQQGFQRGASADTDGQERSTLQLAAPPIRKSPQEPNIPSSPIKKSPPELVTLQVPLQVDRGLIAPPPSPAVASSSSVFVSLPSLAAVRAPKPQPPLPQKHLTFLPQPPLDNLSRTVDVLAAKNPGDFYCTLCDAFDPMTAMMEKLTDAYSREDRQSLQQPVKIGTACAAKYKVDSQWYRGEVISVNGRDVQVRFVDYGNCQTCSIDTLKVIDEEFMNLPPQAYNCTLNGLDTIGMRTWTTEDIERFESYTLDKSIRAKFGTRTHGKYPVRLIDDSEGGRVINSCFGGISTNVPVPSKGYDMLPQDGRVALAWYDDLEIVDTFFLSPIDFSPYQAQLDELEQFYSALLDDELIETEPRIGLPCVVCFKDDSKFYRTAITSIDGETANVLFVDFGNSQFTLLAEIRRIVPQFLQFPQLVWPCHLNGVVLKKPLTEEHRSILKSCYNTNERYSAVFRPLSKEGSFPVDLCSTTVGDITQHLIKKQVVEPLPADEAVEVIPVAAVSTTPAVAPSSIVESVAAVPQAAQIDVVELPPQNSDFVEAQKIGHESAISHIFAVSEFWIHLYPALITAMEFNIKSITSKPDFNESVPNLSPLTIGRPCLVYSTDYEQYFRAVIDSLKDDQTATVFYVDYGNRETMDFACIKVLPLELAQQPALAVKCSLDGLSSETTTPEITKRLDEFLEMNCIVEFVSRKEDTILVRLFDLEGKNILDDLPTSVAPNKPVESLQTLAGNAVILDSAIMPLPVLPQVEVVTLDQLETAPQSPVKVEDKAIAIQADVPPIEAVEIDTVACQQVTPETLETSLTGVGDDNDVSIAFQPIDSSVEMTYCSVTPGVKEESSYDTTDPLSPLKSEECPAIVCEMSQVTISHYTSPSEFWVQLKSDQKQLSFLTDQLKDLDSCAFVDHPMNGKLYAAKHPDYSTYFRVQIASNVAFGMVDAYFIDYGDYQQVAVADIRLLPRGLDAIKPLASKCCLKDCEGRVWTRVEVDFFSRAIQDLENGSYSADLGECKGGIFMVKSIYAENGRNLVADLHAPFLPTILHHEEEKIQDQSSSTSGYMVSSLSPVEEEIEPISESSEGAKKMELEPIPEAAEGAKKMELETTVEYPRKSFRSGELISSNASACAIESANEIWIHTDSELIEEMNKTCRYISHLSEFADLPVLNNPTVGCACMVRCADRLWRRGSVVSIKGEAVVVRLVDFGLTEAINCFELRPLPIVLAQLPPLAIKCSLDGTSDDTTLPTRAECKIVLFDKQLVAHCVQQIDDTVIVILQSGGVNLNAILGLKVTNLEESLLDMKSPTLTDSEPMEISTSINLDPLINFSAADSLLVAPATAKALYSFGDQLNAETTAEDASLRTTFDPNLETTTEEGDSPYPPRITVSIGEETDSGKKKVICSDETTASASRVDSSPVEEKKSGTPVHVSHIESPGCFWLQLASSIGEITAIEDKLIELKVDFNPKYALDSELVCGKLYAVYHLVYDGWYRARLLSHNNESAIPEARVLFIDYGDTQTVLQSQMRELPEELEYRLPLASKAAIRTAVFGSENWPAETKQTLENLCPSDVLCEADWTSVGDVSTDSLGKAGPNLLVQSLKTAEGINVIDQLMQSASFCEAPDESIALDTVQLTSTPAQLPSDPSSPNPLGAQLLFVDSAQTEAQQDQV